jgi:lipopolysaccharide export system permease protein
MLFHSSIRQELARSFVATLVVLITVALSMMLIRTLGLAAKGSVNPADVMMLMGYAGLGHLSTIMTLSLFIAVTSTLTRMYRESEMDVWFASGQGLSAFVSPLLRFSWPILLAITALALIVWPWSAQQTNKLRSQFEQRSDLDRVSIGQFQENRSGSRVVFVEGTDRDKGISEGESQSQGEGKGEASSTPAGSSTLADITNKQVRNVFVAESDDRKQTIVSARSGSVERINNEPFIVLKNGQRVEQDTNGDPVKVIEFAEYSVLASAGKLGEQQAPPAKSLNTLELLANHTSVNMAELSWRIGLVLAAFNLLFLALLLSAVNPRAGRGFGLAFALLAFVVYYNLLNVGFSRIASGRSSFAQWMLLLHGSVFVLTLLWMFARHNHWSWRQLLPRRAPRSTSAFVES